MAMNRFLEFIEAQINWFMTGNGPDPRKDWPFKPYLDTLIENLPLREECEYCTTTKPTDTAGNS